MNIYESRLRAVLSAIQRYLPPDGASAHDTLSEIIGLVDPWPAAPHPAVQQEVPNPPCTDERMCTPCFTGKGECEYPDSVAKPQGAIPPELGLHWREDIKRFVRRNANWTDTIVEPRDDTLREVAATLNQMMGSALARVAANGDVIGYVIKTGAIHRLIGYMQNLRFPVNIPMNMPEDAAAPQPSAVPPDEWLKEAGRQIEVLVDHVYYRGLHDTGRRGDFAKQQGLISDLIAHLAARPAPAGPTDAPSVVRMIEEHGLEKVYAAAQSMLYGAPAGAVTVSLLTPEKVDELYDEVKGKGWALDFATAIQRALVEKIARDTGIPMEVKS